ncbi:MAG: VWA domain-containing protein, partial [Lentisphaerae bacterium]
MKFLYPEALTIFIIVILVLIKRYMNPPPSLPVPWPLPVKDDRFVFRLHEILLLLGIISLVISLSKPHLFVTRERTSQGVNIVLCLDVSGSMKAVDLEDQNLPSTPQILKRTPTRLATACEALMTFIRNRPNDRIGLVVFASHPLLLAPLTLQHDFLLNQIKNLKPGMIDDSSTRIGPALQLALQSLINRGIDHSLIILISDGFDDSKEPPTPEQAARWSRDHGILIHTLAVGSSNAFIAQNPGAQPRQWLRVSEFDPRQLQKIAKISGGSFFHAKR